MKRKALITSTAILLVAIMCLATASYAWFTAGSASSVASMNLSISAGSTGLSIAPADALGATFAPQSFKTTAITDTELTSYAHMPAKVESNYALEPVSTDGTFVNDYNFYEAPAGNYDDSTGLWTVQAANNNEYVLFSFYVRYDGTAEANYKATITSSLFENGNFTNAVKVGTNVTDTKIVDNVVQTVKPGNLTVANLSADPTPYKALTSATSTISNDTAAKAFVGTDATAAMADETALSDITLSFNGAGAKLVTVAVWLEGQDYDCQGSISVNASSFNITLAEVA